MSLTLYPSTRDATIGEVLDTGFRIFRATMLQTLPYGVLAVVAGKCPHLYVMFAPANRPPGLADPLWWTFDAIGALLVIAAINAILLRQSALSSGQPSGVGEALRGGLRKTPVTATVFALVLFMISLCFAPLLAVPRSYLSWSAIALAIPGAYVGVRLSCAWAAALLGGRGVLGSLSHSFHLVRSNWWRTAIIYLIGAAMLGVFYTLAGVVAAVLVAAGGSANIAVMTAVSAEVVAALAALGLPFYLALALALYRDLESRQDALALDRPVADAAAG